MKWHDPIDPFSPMSKPENAETGKCTNRGGRLKNPLANPLDKA